MKKIKVLLLAGGILAMGLVTQNGSAQTFTFSTIAGGSQGTNDGVGSEAQFYKPTGVAVDPAGNVYVADEANNAIREITPSGTNWTVITIAGGSSGSQDGTNTEAQFSAPTGIVLDSATNLYVADQLNYTIRKLTPTGTNWVVSTIAGQARVAGTNNGVYTNAQFHNPTGIALDNAGNLFVADQFNNAIRELVPAGTNWTVSTIAGGSQGAADGTNTEAQFYFPTGVAVDTNDRLFVADQFNNAIRLITPVGPNWVVTTIAGQPNAGDGNGLGTNVEFTSPVGVAVDTTGEVYVSDLYTIRELSPSGTNWLVSTIGGNAKGTNDGVGTNAQFYLPFGLATDAYGDLFVADSGNNAIRLGLSSEGAPPLGSLEVTLTPSNAVTDGAQWQVDNGPLQTNGTTLSGLTPGNHIVTFSSVAGFTTPAYQPIIITAHQMTTITGNYPVAIPNAGSLEVLISPADAVAAGAEWQVDSEPLQTNGAVVPGLAIGPHILSFNTLPGWTSPDSQTVYITNAQTTLGLGTYLVGSLPNYTVTVNATPGADGTVGGGGTFPEGTSNTVRATANSGFEFIGWTGDATGTGNPLTVTVNTNLNITAYFAATGSTSLIVITTGDGTVSPDLNGKELKAGRSYSLKATPASGNLFSNWTGSITTNKNPLSIKMESSMVLQANFVPNPFLPVKGTYNGLFFTSNGVTEQTAGMLKQLTINQKGTYSGALLINGGSHGISGSFDLAGQATNAIKRSANQGGLLTLTMTLLTSSNSAPEVTGTVSGTANGVSWAATNLVADLATNTLPSAQYTMLIPPDTNNVPPTNSPGGDGYALITNHTGTAKITGALADGTAFSQSVPVSEDGYVPVYANLYASKGLLLGWINLSPTNTTDVSLTWIHPPRPSGLYPGGFTNVLFTNQILLSPWTNPPGNLGSLTNLLVVATINGSNTPIPVTINSGMIAGASVKGTINSRNGLLKVTVGTGPDRVNGFGAILLNATNGGGYFLIKTNAQAIQLQP